MAVKKCGVPSCSGRLESVSTLGVCARCAHPASYGDDFMSSIFDDIDGRPHNPNETDHE